MLSFEEVVYDLYINSFTTYRMEFNIKELIFFMLNMLNKTTMRFAKKNDYIALDLAKDIIDEFDIFDDY